MIPWEGLKPTRGANLVLSLHVMLCWEGVKSMSQRNYTMFICSHN